VLVPQIVFWLMAAIAVLGSLGVIASRRPIRSVLSLVAVMLALSVIFLELSAQFMFAVQVIVYAAAVMVLFLFVVSLPHCCAGRLRGQRVGQWFKRGDGRRGPLAGPRRCPHPAYAHVQALAQVAEDVPALAQRRLDVEHRPEELDAALQVGVAVLRLGEADVRQDHVGPQLGVPDGDERRAGRDAAGGRRPPRR
jgi:hypothetical protein